MIASIAQSPASPPSPAPNSSGVQAAVDASLDRCATFVESAKDMYDLYAIAAVLRSWKTGKGSAGGS